jgi:uncharacterized cysteine cluster protein YcgN (CxxCxxCC family)
MMVVVVMMVMTTGCGKCGASKHQHQQNSSEKLFHEVECSTVEARGTWKAEPRTLAPTCGR